LYGVSTMDLSEARGLVLFRVVREGILAGGNVLIADSRSGH
jgi:hypothetical protein